MYDYRIDSGKIHLMEKQLEAVASGLIEDACLGSFDAESSRVFVQSVITDLRRWEADTITPPGEITLAYDAIFKAHHLISEPMALNAADAHDLEVMTDDVLHILEEAEREAICRANA